MAIDLLDEKDSDQRDINCNPFYFDGTKAHGTEPFEGHRYSFVFYCAKKGEPLSQDQYSYLKELGFNPPLRLETYQCEVGDGVAQDDELQEETELDSRVTVPPLETNLYGRTTISPQTLVVDHVVSEDIQLKAEESKLVNCHMGETLPTMEGTT